MNPPNGYPGLGGGGFGDGGRNGGQPSAPSPASPSQNMPLTPEAQWAYLVNAAVTRLHLPPEIAALGSTSELREMLECYPHLHQPRPRTFPWEAQAREELIPWITAHDHTAPPPAELASAGPVVLRRHASRALETALTALRAGEAVNVAANMRAGPNAMSTSGCPPPGVYVRPPPYDDRNAPDFPGGASPRIRPPPGPGYGYGQAQGTPRHSADDGGRVGSPYTSPVMRSLTSPVEPFRSPPPLTPRGMSAHTSPYPVRQYLSPNGSTWIDGYITSLTPLMGGRGMDAFQAPDMPPIMPLPPTAGTPPMLSGQPEPVHQVIPGPGMQPTSSAQVENRQQQDHRQQVQEQGGVVLEDGQGRRAVAAGEIPVRSERTAESVPPLRGPGGHGSGRRAVPRPADVRPDVHVSSARRREETKSEKSRRHTNVPLPPRKVQDLLRKYEHDKSTKFTEWEIQSMEAYRRKQNHDARALARREGRQRMSGRG
jgi:hypothetical protein